MQAVSFDPATDRFSLAQVEVPEPGRGEVRVRVRACALNPVDAKLPEWKAMAPGMTGGWVPGLDVAGEIDAVGDDVDGWSVGDRVLYHGNMLRPHGGFATHALHAAATLLPCPVDDWVTAAATPCAGWTAWRAVVEKLRVGPETTFYLAGASGGVGTFALQIARHAGAREILASCSAANHELVLGLGATRVVDYRSEDVVARVLALTDGRGVDAALDCVGGEQALRQAGELLAYGGALVPLVDVARPDRVRDAFLRNLSFHQVSLGAAHGAGPRAREGLLAAGRAVGDLLAAGELVVPVLERLTLAEVPDALGALRAQHTRGKLVACP